MITTGATPKRSNRVERHLALCAFLRHDEAACREYASLKLAVFAKHPADIAAYNNGKDAWIKRVELIAIAWYRREFVKSAARLLFL